MLQRCNSYLLLVYVIARAFGRSLPARSNLIVNRRLLRHRSAPPRNDIKFSQVGVSFRAVLRLAEPSGRLLPPAPRGIPKPQDLLSCVPTRWLRELHRDESPNDQERRGHLPAS